MLLKVEKQPADDQRVIIANEDDMCPNCKEKIGPHSHCMNCIGYGHFIKRNPDYICSHCEEKADTEWNYCPNCGNKLQ